MLLTDPLELERLALDRPPGHMGDGPQDAQGRPETDALDVVEKRLQREREHRVADVDRDRDAMVDVQRGLATAPPGFVLDVVVDEEGVVVELQRRRRRQDRLEVAAEPEAGRDAQGRPKRLSAAKRVVEDQVVEAVRPASDREHRAD